MKILFFLVCVCFGSFMFTVIDIHVETVKFTPEVTSFVDVLYVMGIYVASSFLLMAACGVILNGLEYSIGRESFPKFPLSNLIDDWYSRLGGSTTEPRDWFASFPWKKPWAARGACLWVPPVLLLFSVLAPFFFAAYLPLLCLFVTIDLLLSLFCFSRRQPNIFMT